MEFVKIFDIAQPIADGSSFYVPNFLQTLGVDADALFQEFVSTDDLFIPRNDPASLYRGNELTREKFYVNLCSDDRVAKYSFPGFQWEAMERLYLPRTDPRSTVVVDLAERLDRVLGYKSNQCIGTLYDRATDCIGSHSDRPLDLANNSWIINISLGDHRDFRMKERNADEQTIWIAKNEKAEHEMYENKSGKHAEDVFMMHGSAILLSTSTNSRWTHEVPPPQHADWSKRVSLCFRDISTQVTQTKLANEARKSREMKKLAAEKKAAKRARLDL
jgi:alkylated DNA repair dioxygenase AlkB